MEKIHFLIKSHFHAVRFSVWIILFISLSSPSCEWGLAEVGFQEQDADADEMDGVDGMEAEFEIDGSAWCGNGTVDIGEECDDGNAVNGDGCNNDCTYSCHDNPECRDDEICNGEEICNTETHACEAGTNREDGFPCGEYPLRICVDGNCMNSVCGDGIVDSRNDEFCEPPGEGSCNDDCKWSCEGDDDCPDDGEDCNGEEYCNLDNHVCDRRDPLAEGTECDDGLFCTLTDECNGSGNCIGMGETCDDGLDCTTDSCDESADVCTNAVNSGYCVIDDICYADDDENPANDCQECDSSVNQAGWTNKTEEDFRCTVSGAEKCEGGVRIDLGPCPLGCNETTGNCHIPSNVPVGLMDPAAGNIDLTGGDTDIYINTETGRIYDSFGNDIRQAIIGNDPVTGTTFAVVDQGSGDPPIGVFIVGEFTIPSGTTLHGEGANALAIAASGNMVIDGIIDVCAGGQGPGPGGGSGGDADAAGTGTCPGSPGSGTGTNHTSGGGAGGFGGAGGKGGDDTSASIAGGAGGGPCGTPELSPLIGGSGGGGGGTATGNPSSSPGTGGGGGGAVQLISALSITFGGSGGIHAGGDGGGECDRGGGGGGGAGGAALIEAPDVDAASGATIAANGGGGGAGDCT